MKIIVGAVSSQFPFSAGNQCNWVHWVEGLRRLGHYVYFIEQIGKNDCFDSKGNKCAFENSTKRIVFRYTMKQFGLLQNACLIYEDNLDTEGLAITDLETIAKEADLLLNFSGCISARVVMDNVKRRAFMDTDPVYTQLWQSEYQLDINLINHDIFFTVGLNIGTSYSPIPDCGLKWEHISRPMVLDMWPYEVKSSCSRFTTVAAWKVFGDIAYRGERYHSKAYELERFITVPERTEQEIEIALTVPWGDKNPTDKLREHGWHILQADFISNSDKYKNYIEQSRGEIGIAKNAYVKSSSGWFSDRSAHYLSCGKPVLHQSTGFERVLPTGLGVLCFGNMDELLSGIDDINSSYEKHCQAAHQFAEEYLDYKKVIPYAIEKCMAQSSEQSD